MTKRGKFPTMCGYHGGIFDRLNTKRKKRVRHPGEGRANLIERATDHAKACPQCIEEPKP